MLLGFSWNIAIPGAFARDILQNDNKVKYSPVAFSDCIGLGYLL
jgi:hypothetical protein